MKLGMKNNEELGIAVSGFCQTNKIRFACGETPKFLTPHF
jgi:hypothetical protein